MIKVEVPKGSKYLRYDLLFSYVKPDNRPYEYDGDEDMSLYMFLSDRLHNWFTEHNISYEIFEEKIGLWSWCYILFKNKEDAILFKLTWSGK